MLNVRDYCTLCDLDAVWRYCRLWDLGQQRCIHSYAVHTDSVWTLASTPSFSHVYSGGKDLSVREASLMFSTSDDILKPEPLEGW
jgi:WD repeat-containing protein 48